VETGGSKHNEFGSEGVRSQRIAKLKENNMIRPLYEITSPSCLSDKLLENTMLYQHGIGYVGNNYGYLGDNPQTIIGLCCENHGVSLSYYPPIRLSEDLRLKTKAIVPSFEFLNLGIMNENDVNTHKNAAKNLLECAGISLTDTINDIDYKARRLEYAFKIMPHITRENLEGMESSETIKRLMTATQIADLLLSLEERDTIVIADQGSAGPIIQAKNIAEKLGIENVLSGIIYLEPPDLQNENFMYYADFANKILLGSEPEKEAAKILRAKSAGGTKEQFKAEGGDYYGCAVGEVDSIISDGSGTVREKCETGTFEGCRECKYHVQNKLEKFLENINRPEGFA